VTRNGKGIDQALVWIGLVAAGVGLRLSCQEVPNFAPVAGLALFAGYYFTHAGLALLAPLTVMVITDAFLGGYQPLLQLTVYACLALPVCLRSWVRSRLARINQMSGALAAAGGLLMSSVACSLAFYLVTNGMTWVVTPWYARSWEGLAECLISGLPFFRYTLAGDLCFTTLLFGGYLLATFSSRTNGWLSFWIKSWGV
jgi:hypothetical protein